MTEWPEIVRLLMDADADSSGNSSGITDLPGGLRGWRHCPRCAELLKPAINEPGAQPHLVCSRCSSQYYANPKPTASALAVRADGRLMLVKRAIEPFFGYWDLPGGFIEDGEDAADAVVREVLEETRMSSRVVGISSIIGDTYGDQSINTLNIFFEVCVDESTIANATPSSDCAEIGWFEPDLLPSDLAFSCVCAAIEHWKTSRKSDSVG